MEFVVAGRPERVLSGALHYFRVLPEQWSHRLRMLRAMGLNTVETYVPWNWHEPRRGEVRRLEQLSGFLELAQAEGLDAIVRPGPFICAEWDNGGLPAWLTGRSGVSLRCMDDRYLAAVDTWFDVLIPVLARHQVTRGGNVIMVQVENEYGSYGSDQEYLEYLRAGLVRRGVEVPLFTSDGPTDWMITGGTLPGVLATMNFGSDAKSAFEVFRAHRPDDPLFCMEFWCGWFDHWGSPRVTREAADAAGSLREILECGASVNIYMAHGGTNFGVWAGANRGDGHLGELQPDVTSYDYDAPIDERGAATEKFWRFREVLQSYVDHELPAPPPPAPLLPPQEVPLVERLSWWACLPETPVRSPTALSFEELGLVHGLVAYRTSIPGPRAPMRVHLDGLADHAWLFVDGVPTAPDAEIPGPAVLDVLVESMGRTNYGPLIGERKGITGGVRHGQQILHGFSGYPMELENLDVARLPWASAPADQAGPFFARGVLEIDEPADTWLTVPGGVKGYVWVNGFCLGRYWAVGPQRALYLPWPLLRAGANEIVLLELAGDPASVALTTAGQA